jgi:hypothetical protein
MGDHTLGRREILLGAGVVAGSVAVTGLGAAPAAADHDDDRDDDRDDDLTGSWLVTREDDDSDEGPVKNVFSFAAGGVLISRDIEPAAPPFLGTWDSSGSRFKATIWTGVGPPPGSQEGGGAVVRVRVRGRHDDDEISGTYDVLVAETIGGPPTFQSTGSFTGSPIDA